MALDWAILCARVLKIIWVVPCSHGSGLLTSLKGVVSRWTERPQGTRCGLSKQHNNIENGITRWSTRFQRSLRFDGDLTQFATEKRLWDHARTFEGYCIQLWGLIQWTLTNSLARVSKIVRKKLRNKISKFTVPHSRPQKNTGPNRADLVGSSTTVRYRYLVRGNPWMSLQYYLPNGWCIFDLWLTPETPSKSAVWWHCLSKLLHAWHDLLLRW
jgi:hypothetical protein